MPRAWQAVSVGPLRRLAPTLPLVLALAALAAFPGSALGAGGARYASPTGSDPACTMASPCSFDTAVESASPEDNVYVRGDQGDYAVIGDVGTPDKIHVYGINGRPRLIWAGDGSLQLGGANSSAENLYLEVKGTGSAPTFSMSAGGEVDNIVAKSAGARTACFQRGTTLRNSVCWASGDGAIAIHTPGDHGTNTDTLSNVTAIASGSGGVAVKLQGFNGDSAVMNLTNVIARGDGDDLFAETAEGSGNTTINTTTSDWLVSAFLNGSGSASVNGTPLTLAPKFVDAAGGDFHQACGSPTIDAGTDSPSNGTNDFDGDARALGVTDIGADEFGALAPTGTTGTATGISPVGALLHGTVNPQACAATYSFDYGTTTAYGKHTPDQTLPVGRAAVPVSAPLSGLEPGKTYHYRMRASNSVGSVPASDATFTTAADAFAGVVIRTTKAKVKKKKVSVSLQCPASTTGACTGALSLTSAKKVAVPAKKGKKAKKAYLVTEVKSFSIAPGKTAGIKIKASKKLLKLLKAKGKLRMQGHAIAHDGFGIQKNVLGVIDLKVAKKKKKH